MTTRHERYLVDADGHRIAVVLPIEDYERLLEDISERDDIRAYDRAKAADDEVSDLEDALVHVDEGQRDHAAEVSNRHLERDTDSPGHVEAIEASHALAPTFDNHAALETLLKGVQPFSADVIEQFRGKLWQDDQEIDDFTTALREWRREGR